ncbi:hypothetical protein ACFVXE_09285 [Streptomyces sp. NPDC058231]|uniref:hypothetical protein n=1 Tax=Streptomyces sp. NPDC058231 TaxID=3346392 RepID=UPI0036EB0CAB
MTEAEPETQRVLPKALALYDKGVGIARIASQLPVGASVQPAAVSHFPHLPAQRPIPLRLWPDARYSTVALHVPLSAG